MSSDSASVSTVAVGTDGSDTANEAVRQAAEISRRFDAKLVLLSAFQDSGAVHPERDIELQWSTNSAARIGSMLQRMEEELRADGLRCETRAAEGDPADVLVQLAEDAGADLLVIGNKGMTRRILGSVPNSVTHKAGCSVLIVKTT